jgi:hypothetical protein
MEELSRDTKVIYTAVIAESNWRHIFLQQIHRDDEDNKEIQGEIFQRLTW